MKNIKTITIIAITAIVCISSTVYATTKYLASEVTYKNTTVENALNELYNKIKSSDDMYDAFNKRLQKQKIKSLNNGVEIKKDENNDYYFHFDGIDDYIQLENLSSNIDIKSGFIVTFKVRWDEFKYFSRIFELSNGSPRDNNIGFENYHRTGNIALYMYLGTTGKDHVSDKLLEINKTYNIEVKCIKNSDNYDIKYFVNGNEFYSTSSSQQYANIDRNNNYIAKTSWTDSEYFKGRIYNFKLNLADGTTIYDIDVNKLIKN